LPRVGNKLTQSQPAPTSWKFMRKGWVRPPARIAEERQSYGCKGKPVIDLPGQSR
jgi:hypothetical protein